MTPHVAASTTSPTGTGAANPSSVAQGGSTTLTVTVTPGSNPDSTGLAVTGDLSSVGGGASVAFHDNGDGTFSTQATVAAATSTGAKSIPFTVTDGQSRSGSGSIALTVTAAGGGSGPDLTGLVISQVYGGGGNSGAPYTKDFIELFNPTDAAVGLAGASVQYASATGTSWQVTSLTGSIAAHHYYLVRRRGRSRAGSAADARRDRHDQHERHGGQGRPRRLDDRALGQLPGGPRRPRRLRNRGLLRRRSGPPAAPSNSASDQRANGGCQDTNVNSADFSMVLRRLGTARTSTRAPRRRSPARRTHRSPWARRSRATVTASDPNGQITSIGIASVSPSSGSSAFSVTGFTASGNSGRRRCGRTTPFPRRLHRDAAGVGRRLAAADRDVHVHAHGQSGSSRSGRCRAPSPTPVTRRRSSRPSRASR